MADREISEGLLLDCILKRRAGNFDAEDFSWAIDHMGFIRWVRQNPYVMEFAQAHSSEAFAEFYQQWLAAKKARLAKAKDSSPFQQVEHLLRFVSRIEIPVSENFVAADHFKMGCPPVTEVVINNLSDSVGKYFFGQPAESSVSKSLICFDLLQKSNNMAILKEIDKVALAETSLSDIWGLLLLQPHGEEGSLLTGNFVNLFFVRDKNGNLEIIAVYWRMAGGWSIYTASAEALKDWLAGVRVFVRSTSSH